MRRAAACVTLALLIPAVAHAACNVSASAVVFGVFNTFFTGNTDVTGTVTMGCSGLSGGGAYTIKLGPGSGGSYAGRQITSGTASLTYQLYTYAARTLVWSDGTGGSSVVNGADGAPFFGGASIHTVYARIAPGQGGSPGSYVDSIQVTISY